MTVPARELPTIHRNIDVLANRAFGMRWQSGVRNPLDSSFEFVVDALLAGLAAAVADGAERDS